MRKLRPFLALMANALYLFPIVAGHSWVDELTVIAANGTFIGAPGYPRGYVPRDTPGFSDLMMQYLLPLPPASRPGPPLPGPPKFLPTDNICRDTQVKQVQTDGQPRLKARPGSPIALRYQENGHVTLPSNTPGKPDNRGTVYIYGTTDPKPDDKFTSIHKIWNKDGTGGDRRGMLLSVQDYDDGRCYQINDQNISKERQKEFPHKAATPQGQNLWCQHDLALPKNVPEGKPYTLYWVWDWPTIPDAKKGIVALDEVYTTCMDIDITPASRLKVAAKGEPPALKFVEDQDLGSAAIPTQFENLKAPMIPGDSSSDSPQPSSPPSVASQQPVSTSQEQDPTPSPNPSPPPTSEPTGNGCGAAPAPVIATLTLSTESNSTTPGPTPTKLPEQPATSTDSGAKSVTQSDTLPSSEEDIPTSSSRPPIFLTILNSAPATAITATTLPAVSDDVVTPSPPSSPESTPTPSRGGGAVIFPVTLRPDGSLPDLPSSTAEFHSPDKTAITPTTPTIPTTPTAVNSTTEGFAQPPQPTETNPKSNPPAIIPLPNLPSNNSTGSNSTSNILPTVAESPTSTQPEFIKSTITVTATKTVYPTDIPTAQAQAIAQTAPSIMLQSSGFIVSTRPSSPSPSLPAAELPPEETPSLDCVFDDDSVPTPSPSSEPPPPGPSKRGFRTLSSRFRSSLAKIHADDQV
ncbi:hypothetical protein EMCG_04232 [[Emmonsia] crescens]|uniref:DUF7492 domain-containing protein n=1 Tax=[Emmonsia] crescens TaxID=73230 RepID=A0A0G2J7P7_9EURO|nr:hypothetical protein EMCG_04232 [Emmonsia crescens UAMH 3008]